jgi:hypothetical protein
MSATYKAVTMDDQEHADLDLEALKQLYFAGRLRPDSFVLSSETGEWRLLKNFFDPALWEEEEGTAKSLDPHETFFNAEAPQPPRWAPAAIPRTGSDYEAPKKRRTLLTAGVLVAALALSAVAGVSRLNNNTSDEAVKRQIRRYAIQDRSFRDGPSGVSLELPDGWVMLPQDNPVVPDSGTDVIAVHAESNSFVTIKTIWNDKGPYLDEALTMVVDKLREHDPSVQEIDRVSSSFANLETRKTVLRWRFEGKDVNGEISVAKNGSGYIFISEWCAMETAAKSQPQFTAFENGASVERKSE